MNKKEQIKEKIRNEIECFMEHDDVLTKLDSADWGHVEDELVKLFSDDTICQAWAAMLYDRYRHEDDVRTEIFANGIEPLEEDIERTTDIYEKYLDDDNSWYCDLSDAIYDFMTKR